MDTLFKILMVIGMGWLLLRPAPHPTPSPLLPDHHYIQIAESRLDAMTGTKVRCVRVTGPVVRNHNRRVWVCVQRDHP